MRFSPAIAAVLGAVMINMTGVGLVWPILPSLVAELHDGPISEVAIFHGAIAVVFSAMQFVFAPLLGALSDRFGRRPVMLVALAGLGLDTLLLALAPSLVWMFIGRALGGIFGATFSVASAYMADLSERGDRAAYFGLIGAAFGIGFIVGPLLGGVLGAIDLRLPFYAAAGLSLANLVLGWFFLAETLPPEKRRPVAGSGLNPFLTLKWILHNRAILPLAVALLAANLVQRGLEAVWVLFTQFQYDWDVRAAGLSLTVVGISYIVVQGLLVKPVVRTLGENRTILAGFLLSAAMMAVLSVNTISLIGYAGIVPHVLGWGLALPALQSLASQQVDPSEQGALQGGLTAITGLSSIFGPLVATGIFSYFTSDSAPFGFAGAFFAMGALLLVGSAMIGSLRRA